MKTIICALFLFFSFSAFAQYPFEKYPAIKFIKIPFNYNSSHNQEFKVGAAKYGDYRMVLAEKKDLDSSSLSLYFQNKLITKVIIGWDITSIESGEPLYVGDINGDGLLDFKLSYYNPGASGLASSRVWKRYFFNEGKNHFRQIIFGDFFGKSNREYDFNNDKNYEIIGQHYVSYKNHAYWCFDLYNYKKGKLINVSNSYNYPIMTRFLGGKESYSITTNLSRAKMKTFSSLLPEFYEEGK